MTKNSEKTAVIGQPFPKGVSGNPNGRPKGKRNFDTLFKEAITKIAEADGKTLDEMEEQLVQVGYDKAREGDYRFWQDIFDRLHGKPISRNENLNLNRDMDKLEPEERERLNNLINGQSEGA